MPGRKPRGRWDRGVAADPARKGRLGFRGFRRRLSAVPALYGRQPQPQPAPHSASQGWLGVAREYVKPLLAAALIVAAAALFVVAFRFLMICACIAGFVVSVRHERWTLCVLSLTILALLLAA